MRQGTRIAGIAALTALMLTGAAAAQEEDAAPAPDTAPVAESAPAPETAPAAEAPAETAPGSEIANNTAFGDWILTCDAVTTSRTACRLVQEQSLRETGELVARFIAVPVADGAILLAQVPMGVYLPGSAVYRFEGEDALEQREMIWQRCADTVCEAAAPLDEDELQLFADHDALLFGFRMTAQSEPIVLRVDISEFADAMDVIRETNG